MLMVVKNNLSSIFSNLFISSIELIFMIITQYSYTCDISYYPIMQFILQHKSIFVEQIYALVSDI